MKNRLKRFHRDERGLEALQVILIVAIAAIILAALKMFWADIRDLLKSSVQSITGWNLD